MESRRKTMGFPGLRWFPLAVAIWLMAPGFVHPAFSARDFSPLGRVALVIGNGSYDIGMLRNATNDAKGMAEALESVGFDVLLRTDVGKAGMKTAIREFGNRLGEDAVGLFYYAGHGVRVNGKNYLLPVGADIECENEVEFEAIRADRVLTMMESARSPLNLMILDACRDNPLKKTCSRGSLERGLESMGARSGTKILFATHPGEKAFDGDGRHSPFTESLMREIRVPGREIEGFIKAVTLAVHDQTGGKQVPYEEGSSLGDFYFLPARAGAEKKPLLADSGGVEVVEPVRPRPAEPVHGELLVETNVPNAAVLLNDRERGRGSLQFRKMLPGAYRITVEAEGYDSFQKTVTVSAGQSHTLKAYLEAAGPDEPAPGEIVRGPLGMEFAWIPPGTFMMGSPEDEPGRDGDETRHRVTLTEGFWMQTTEVTQGQWKAVMGSNPSSFKNCGDDCPVENVSWNDVQEFIQKLNARGQGTYRLPTEAQWEYAARAGTETAFYFGENLDCSQANFGNGWSSECEDENPGETMKVGSFPANRWGLRDMHGNVWEWTADWRGDYPAGSVTNPTGSSSGSSRVVRGGSWFILAAYCRSADRHGFSPGYRDGYLGFRLSRQP